MTGLINLVHSNSLGNAGFCIHTYWKINNYTSANLNVCSLLCPSQRRAVSWFATNMDRRPDCYCCTGVWAFCYVHSMRWANPSYKQSYQMPEVVITIFILANLMHKILFYNKFYFMPLHVSSIMCSSSGGQNCIIQPLVSSHLNKWVA